MVTGHILADAELKSVITCAFSGCAYCGFNLNLNRPWDDGDGQIRVVKNLVIAINHVIANHRNVTGKVSIWGKGVVTISINGDAANRVAIDIGDGGWGAICWDGV